LLVEVYKPEAPPQGWTSPARNPYGRQHGE
jgi:uncharacterized protein